MPAEPNQQVLSDASQNYPTTVPVYGHGGGWDIVVTKLNASGSALIGSMRIGGSAG